MNTQLNKEQIIKARKLKSEEDYQVFEDIAQLANQKALTIDDFDTLCYGFDDESEDYDYSSEGLTQCINSIMEAYSIEDFTEKLVDAIDIFNNHALLSYGFILSQWFIEDEKITMLCASINTKNEDTKEIFRQVLSKQIEFYNNYVGLGYIANGANKVLQCISTNE